MKALIICVGSRGDHEPFLALSQRLASEGDHVEFFLQQDYEHLLPESSNVIKHVLPFGSNDFYQFLANPTHGANSEDPVERFIGVVTDCTGELVLPQWQPVYEAASSCDFLITSSLARALMLPISRHLKLPLALIHLQPLLPTKHFPAYRTSSSQQCIEAILNASPVRCDAHEETYWSSEALTFKFLEDRVAKVCAKMNIQPLSFEEEKATVSGRSEGAWIVNAFAEQLVPRPIDAGQKVLQVGPLAADYQPTDWKPEQRLIDFLERCECPPVCVGFGSMPFGRGQELFLGLKTYGQNAVLVGSALEIGDDADEWLQEHTCCVMHAQYAWLLPKCCVMMSHGGAGVMHSAARAGVPQVIAPLMGDQFFWADLIVAKGLGARCEGGVAELTSQGVAEALSAAAKCAHACKKVEEAMALQESPTVALVRRMHEAVAT